MNRIPTVIIIDEMNALRHKDYPSLRSKPEAMTIERLAPEAIAVLALVHRWRGYYLDYKMGHKTIRELMMDAADLKTDRGLAQILESLSQVGLIEIRKESGFLSSKAAVDWSSGGRERIYAYLNDWGWEKLAMALETHHSVVDGGPPLIGGPGLGGWSSADI